MCAFFERGKCSSDTCKYAHSADELKQAPNLQKTKLCKAFLQGKCKEAENCVFAHGEADLRVTQGIYKTQMCNFFQRGHCKKGDRCNHAHGDIDKRPTASELEVASEKTDEGRGRAGSGEASPSGQAVTRAFGDLPAPASPAGSAPLTPGPKTPVGTRRKSGQAMSSTKLQRPSLPLADLLDSENAAGIANAAWPTPTKSVAEMAAMTCSPLPPADLFAQHAAAAAVVAAAATFPAPGPQHPAPLLRPGQDCFGAQRRPLDPIDMLIAPPAPMQPDARLTDPYGFEALQAPPGLAWPQVRYPAPQWAGVAWEAKPELLGRPEALALDPKTSDLGKSLASLDDIVRGLAADVAAHCPGAGGKHWI